MKVRDVFIEWDDRFRLGIPLIDKQHEKLIQLTNDLHVACLGSTETANGHFIDTIHEMVNYVHYHFSTEEKLMLLAGFPKYSTHKKEHTDFIKEVLIQAQTFTNNSHLVPNRFVHFLKEWILSHIAVCDKATVEFIHNTKCHEKLEQLYPTTV